MRSPIVALTWEIWRRGHRSASLALGCVVACSLVNLATPERLRASETGQALFPPLFGLLMVISFLLLMGVFNYTEYSSSKEWNGFPYRLFVLPLRTWQLVTLPMLLGVVSVELVYVAWIKLVWTRETILTPEWFAVVLGAYMIFYQTTIWGLPGFRIVRILVLGLGGVSSIAVACLPMFDKIIPSPWFSERRLIPITVAMAAIAFVIAWSAVARQRRGGGRRQSQFTTVLELVSDVMPRRTKDFASPAGALFWFEWRRSGLLLPLCTAFALVVIFFPYSWVYRTDPRSTMDTLVRILAVPIVLAFATGKGFIKPEFWSTNLAFPTFLATRPLSSGEMVISKMKAAALSVAITWVLVLSFIALWLPLWADTTQLKQLLIEFRMFYPHSWHVITILFLAGLVVFTWRCMVSGLWVGLSGSRLYYFGSLFLQVIVPVLLLLAAGICSNTIDSEIREHAERLNTIVFSAVGWILALAVMAKLWITVFSWSKITPRRTWQYLLIWSGATLCFVALGILSRPWADIYRPERLSILGALLLFPFARLGLAPLFLSKNRHR